MKATAPSLFSAPSSTQGWLLLHAFSTIMRWKLLPWGAKADLSSLQLLLSGIRLRTKPVQYP